MQQILSKMRKAIEEYNMIDEGDKIAVCLSGGKDSITMLNGLKALQRFYPKHFEIIAISINPGFDFFNKEILQKNCDEIGVPLFIEDSNIKEIVFDELTMEEIYDVHFPFGIPCCDKCGTELQYVDEAFFDNIKCPKCGGKAFIELWGFYD